VEIDVRGGPRRSIGVPGGGFGRKSREEWPENLQPYCLQLGLVRLPCFLGGLPASRLSDPLGWGVLSPSSSLWAVGGGAFPGWGGGLRAGVPPWVGLPGLCLVPGGDGARPPLVCAPLPLAGVFEVAFGPHGMCSPSPWSSGHPEVGGCLAGCACRPIVQHVHLRRVRNESTAKQAFGYPAKYRVLVFGFGAVGPLRCACAFRRLVVLGFVVWGLLCCSLVARLLTLSSVLTVNIFRFYSHT